MGIAKVLHLELKVGPSWAHEAGLQHPGDEVLDHLTGQSIISETMTLVINASATPGILESEIYVLWE